MPNFLVSSLSSSNLVPRSHPQIKRAKGGRVWPKDQVVRGLVEFQEFHIIYSSVTAFSNQCRHLMLDDRACPPCEEMAVKTYWVCGKQLHNCRERRKLHSSATSHVLPVLLQALSSHLGSYAGDLDAIAQLLPCDSTYICKNPCFSNLDTLFQGQLSVLVGVSGKWSQCATTSTLHVEYIHPVSSSHSTASLEKDLKSVVCELIQTSKVFKHTAKRVHSSLRKYFYLDQ